ncbi:MAG: PASTA domain-containing protein [Clostridia bacterium]|nr:PASTA domain-containing protein [Clostridia bacterium]
MQDVSKLCMNCMTELGEEETCSACGFSNATENQTGHLPLRTEIKERYVIGTVLDSNGEGVTYIGWDKENDCSVRVREFYPEKIVARDEDGVKLTISTDNDLLFTQYLGEFIGLAKKLEECSDLNNMFKVIDVFEENGTAYYVTENAKTITLREFLLRNGGLLTWDQFKPLVNPVISTLSALHSKGIIHGGISPETLHVGRDGIVRITGFSIQSIRMENSDLSSQLYPGYAAIEQYGFDGKFGAWTDVYSITATIFRVLVGNPPPEATERVSSDHMIIPAKVVETMPQNLLNTMAKGLAIMADDRIKSMDKLKTGLLTQSGGVVGSPTIAIQGIGKKNVDPDSTDLIEDDLGEVSNKKYVFIALALTLIILLIIFYFIWKLLISPNLFGDKDSSSKINTSSDITSSQIVSDETTDGATVVVPQCVGQTLNDILSDVNTALTLKFTVIEKNYSNEYERNTIYYQSIEAGTTVEEGTTIEIKISLGPEFIKVPVVRSMTLEDAKLTLIFAGFQLDNIIVMQKDDTTIEDGKVVGTDIDSGMTVSADSKIIIYQCNNPNGSNQGGGNGGGGNNGGGNNGGGSSSNTSSGGSSTSSDGSSNSSGSESESPSTSAEETTSTDDGGEG